MQQGIICKGIGGFYYVQTEQGMYECKARGVFRKDGKIPLPGDRVHIVVVDEGKKIATIQDILPRSSQLVRPQVANIDQVAVIISLVSPRPDFMLLDKLLVTANSKNIVSLIVINKVDLVDTKHVEAVIQCYESSQCKIFPMSAISGEGTKDFFAALDNKITVLAGQSGVGKSTMINSLKKRVVMATGNISEKIERGKHTTRHAELIPLGKGGYLVDTPGFSSFSLEEMKPRDLSYYYPEISLHTNKCKFSGCIHVNEPGCSVKEAIEQGSFSEERYLRYVQLYQELYEKEKHRYSK